MITKEEIENILKEHSIDHHHEGIVLQESWFVDVAEEIVKNCSTQNVSVSSVSYDEAEEFLQSKDIFHHPYISDRTDSNSYEVADLMAEFFNTINSR